MSSQLEELKAMRVSYSQFSEARSYPLRKMARRGIVGAGSTGVIW
jgi:hypothetical protein